MEYVSILVEGGARMSDLEIVKELIDKHGFNDNCINDGIIMDGSFDFTLMELVEIIKYFNKTFRNE